MITIHDFRKKFIFTEADLPGAGGPGGPGGAAPPPASGGAAGGGAAPPAGDLGGLGGSLGGLGGGLGGATPPDMGGGAPPSELGGAVGGAAGQQPITDIKKLNAWDLLEKYFSKKKTEEEQKDPLEKYM